MKRLMLTGAMIGFGIGIGFSWAQQGAGPSSLWRACVAACLAGWLMRWWGRVWLQGLRQVCDQRQAEALRAENSPNPIKS
jgi:L-asparagine transporter-like permease